ncbi:MAG: methionine adenosyltransferase [Planctomycetota bacterium]
MSTGRYLFTSESVSVGHPDKVADQISDAVLDAILAEDPNGRVACETLVTTGLVLVAGEITTSTYVHIPEIVRKTIKEIGYTDAAMGFDYRTCSVVTSIDKQSPDIAQGVDETNEYGAQGAGDQGLMFGFACRETPELMPMPIMLSHQLVEKQAELRRSGAIPYLRPDAKSQVTIEYQDKQPVRIDTVVLSTQHAEEVTTEQIRKDVVEQIIKATLPKELIDDKTRYLVNPTGRFVVGGPMGDCGLTGRKIIVDTYGGRGRHGGGAFSGKDPSKVDRSACYAARHLAKNIVAADLADECEVQLAYAIGYPQPVSVLVDTYGTNKIDEKKIADIVQNNVDLSAGGIVKRLDLKKPIYQATAAHGHFGRSGFSWEQLDLVDMLRSEAGFATTSA